MDSGYLGGVSVDIDSKKIGSPHPASVPRSLFSAETLGQITIWQFISLLMKRSMIRCKSSPLFSEASLLFDKESSQR